MGRSTSPIKDIYKQLAINIWQRSPEAARKHLGQSVLWMVSIFWGPSNLIHVPNGIRRSTLDWKSRGNFRLFFGYVKAIESIEKYKPVASRQEERFPFLPCRFPRHRRDRLHDYDLGPKLIPIAAHQNVAFCTFDINLQEVDHGGPVLPTQLGKADHRHLDRLTCGAQGSRHACILFAGRRQPMKGVKDVKVDQAGSSSDQSADAGVTRSQARI